MSLTAKATTASASALTTVTELGTGSDLGGVVAALYAATAHDQHKNKTVPLPLLRVAPTSLAHASLVAAAAVHVPGIAIMLATHESNIFEPLAGRVPILLIQYNPLPDLHSLPPIAYSYSESLEFSLEAIESALPKNSPFFKYSGPLTPSTVLVIPGTAPFLFESAISENQRVGILRISVQRPWSAKHLLATIPTSATNIAVLDFVSNFSNAFGTIFLDVAASSATSFNIKEIRVHGEISENVVANILKSAISVFDENAAFMNLHGDIVNSFANVTLSDVPSKEIDIEGPYVSLLNQIFKDRLNLSNVISEASVLQPEIDLKPKQIVSTARSRFIEQAKSLVASSAVSKGVTNPLKAWLQAQEPDSNNASNSVSLGRKAHDALGAARSYQQELSDFYEESGAHLLSPPTLVTATNKAATTPASKNGKLTGTSAEFGLGLHLSQLQERDRFIIKAQEIVASKTLPTNASAPLEAWIAAQTIGTNIATTSTTHGQEAYKHLSDVISTDQSTKYLRDFYQESAAYLLTKPPSRWILGGDALTHDIGASGVHHVVASKSNVNILILDTQPYSEKKNSLSPDTRRKDIGLYAMTYGGVYVASVALQSSFAGVVRALTEADAFNGPSVVVAYAPRVSTAGSASGSGVLVKGGAGLAATAALAALKETKQAVDEGYWPLYRWTPSAFGESSFCLDSEKMRGELEVFLERDRHISLIAAAEPTLELVPSVEKELQADVEAKIKDSYAALVANLNTTPVLILYGSDGGAAAGAAKRLVAEAKQRGLKPKLSVMDEYSVEDFVGHEHVVFVVSTAGQGEFPGNSRETWKALQGLKKGGEVDFGKMRYAVFAMGDSHYWPLPSDAHFFCKSGKDLDAKLEALGAPRLVSIGIGNDRDADGWQTGYKLFAADLWASLGVDFVEVSGPAVMVGTDDAIKEASNFLRGTIAPGLEDTTTGSLAELDQRLTKFHGIYQQDDRDIRESRLRAGLEAAYSFMVRVRVPGGVATPAQWVAIDNVSNKLANGTIKLTTRQAFQFHGIVKSKLKKAIQEINHALMDTLAACGDVNRNVMCNPNPSSSNVHAQVLNFSRKFSAHLTPNTNAYHEIWLDKKMVVTSEDVEPIYGKTYLPRKFKVAVAVPPYNDVDVFAHDLGYISIVDGDNLIGFNVTVGGGMGMTHSMNTTYPRLGDLLGFCTIEQAVNVGEKVVLVQRDFGDRTNRKHARLKYTIDDRGIDWFRNEVEQRLGYKLQPARPYTFISNGDRYGWSQGAKGTWAYTLFIQNGRVKDEEARMMKSGLRTIADDFVRRNVEGIEFRLTPNQHLMIAGVPAAEKWKFEAFLRKYELENGNLSGLRQHSMACVALPTCGLAMAESERYLPDLISLIENVLEVNGLRDDAITIRMTGCPNGCARPQIAEIAFIGKAPGTYNMYLGGGHNGERLNKIYKENLTERDIISELTPIIEDYAKYRANGEHFGDFVIRKNYVKATTSGKHFHDVEKLPTKVESTGQNGVLKIFAGGGSWIGLAFAGLVLAFLFLPLKNE
ncbi:hypothetical protein HK100_003517 [Physocladia obscura]|uniref:assimilatory sulfite reductase (NADPH) n=1 Tax=Physocladia obscura TaxID=109957 RepID=A0AAD5TCN9_9FUNG|nr:hypothetical protein HK100_003517 [Physocladia obscura]